MKKILMATAAAATLGIVAFAVTSSFADPGPRFGFGNGPVQLAHGPGAGSGYGPGSGMGPGMMGYGGGPGTMMGYGPMMGHGMMGYGNGPQQHPCWDSAGGASVDLSADDVTKMLERHLAWRGNDRLKVGKVEQKNDTTYVAEIVTVDNSLVEKLEIDRRTGSTRRVQ